MFNQIILAGRLTKDVELFENKDGLKRAKLSLAVQRGFKARGSSIFASDYFNITLWEGIAEMVAESCKKGMIVIVKGRLENSNYTSKETGKKIYTNNLIGEKVIYLNHCYSSEKEDQEEPEMSEIEESDVEQEVVCGQDII